MWMAEEWLDELSLLLKFESEEVTMRSWLALGESYEPPPSLWARRSTPFLLSPPRQNIVYLGKASIGSIGS